MDALRLSLHVLAWPLVTLARVVLFILSPFYVLIAFILLPVTHLARVFINLAASPFHVHWLERIETLYIYLGTAALVGVLVGGFLFVVFNFLSGLLEPQAPPHHPDTES